MNEVDLRYGRDDALGSTVQRIPLGPRGLGVSLSGSGDFNGDGFVDMLAVEHADTPAGSPSPITVRVLEGNDGGVTAGVSIVDAPLREIIASGDLDGDGYADAIGTRQGVDGFFWYRGGEGSLLSEPPHLVPGAGVQSSVPVGDVDADGFGDVMVAEGTMATSDVRLYRGSRSGPVATSLVWPGHEIIPAGDLDGDGHADFVVGMWITASGYSFVSGAHTSSPASSLSVPMFGSGFDGYLIGCGTDLDGDGYDDLAAMRANLGFAQLVMYHGAGGGPSTATVVATGMAGMRPGISSSMACAQDLLRNGLAEVVMYGLDPGGSIRVMAGPDLRVVATFDADPMLPPGLL